VSPPRHVDHLSLDDVLGIADAILPRVEIRDVGLLAAAVERPRASAFGEDAYPRFSDKAAALLHSLARNHAFVDGNKRIAWSATRVFCLLNGLDLDLDVDAAEALVVGAADGSLDQRALADALERALQVRAGS
jgi:death-on-curing protein